MSANWSDPTFVERHLGPDEAEAQVMLDALGYGSLAVLVSAALPHGLAFADTPELPEPISEHDVQARLQELASRNIQRRNFYGQGYSDTITPPVIRRGVLEDAGWYTAYTPYQPEISQGRLEALLNFQTMIADLTGLPIANASLLDEATAAAEAVGLMSRAVRKGRRVVLDARLHPQILVVAAERARALDLEVEVSDLSQGLVGEDLLGVVIAYPGTEGDVFDPTDIIADIHSRGGLATVVADILALVVLKSPGMCGADIAVGSSQRFGVPLFYGGPHAAFMAVTDKLKRQIPGRIVGVSIDAAGAPAYRLALQTREQHIRREKATSNICTAQALLAVVASMYAVYHGPAGLWRIATRAHDLACQLAQLLTEGGVRVLHKQIFDTVTAYVPDAAAVVSRADDAGYLIRRIGADKVSISFGESATTDDVLALASFFGVPAHRLPEATTSPLAGLRKEGELLSHPIFTSVHSETQMMRYIRKLGDRDLALDRSMIPLGSCTMKLNPTAGMETISYPGFANIHPFAPEDNATGWKELIAELEEWLAKLTGYAKVSVQPPSGAMGELAGLLAIRRFHVSNGDEGRDIVLIPQSAHGTNAASATLAGLRVVVVGTANDGSIDMADLDAKIAQHGASIAGIMITYPSTHGVFEDTVREVCQKVHEAGGQVYIDGANMNALTGIAGPGEFGGDVSHLNLHKTFTIPHGGGGPGVGPVCVAEHLVPFLPGDALARDPLSPVATSAGIPVAGAVHGSAGVLPIPYAYIAMMGVAGLRRATETAILNANYISHQLRDAFPTLYTGDNGLVAHECILDLRELTEKSGVTAADVAKRLVDYGFHAPTLSFPVAGTLMVEPTESEDLAELDRFIEAMRSIRAEIDEVISGAVSLEDSVLRKAPFTAVAIAADDWDEKFTREQAAFPVPGLRQTKYYPAVRRIDEAYGDRNLACSCPPPEAFDLSQQEGGE
ncbi:aminomethyl-transferring glycine dehydrogenase [Corynebacterium sp. H128]|uniref:aminomethyl-transferring glycine dehydrogenase n=1 Tax=Corynebacterium sp. H128 TaxID=3133427 RepID=UPI0030B1A689